MHCQCNAPEEWRAVVGYEGWYSVSSCGRVRRERSATNTASGFILSPFNGRRGYKRVRLSRGTVKNFFVHTLVAAAFIGPAPDGCGVNHINGVKADNHVRNLEWATTQQNVAHAVATGLMQHGDRSPARKHPEIYRAALARRTEETTARGERNGSARLTEDAVRDILSSTLSGAALARKYHVGQSTISRVRRGTAWKHSRAEQISSLEP